MKRFSLIAGLIAAVLPLASCEKEVETIWSDDNAPMLVLNAQILSDDARHTLFVYCSEKSHCDPVEEASVTCTLNSNPLSVEHSEGGRYVFDAQLSAGDRLGFKVSWKDLNATAEAVVPEAVGQITGVTVTEMIIDDEYGSEWKRVQEAISFKDHPGKKDYYMLSIVNVYHHLDEDGNVIESCAVHVSIDAGEDKVLNPMGAEVANFLDYENDYNTFTDEMFADASYTFKVYAQSWYSFNDEWIQFLSRFMEGDPYSIDRVYKVYSIDFDEYMYLNAISANNNGLGIMTEPVVYPGNIDGGLGFVTAASPVTWTVTSGPYTFPEGFQ